MYLEPPPPPPHTQCTFVSFFTLCICGGLVQNMYLHLQGWMLLHQAKPTPSVESATLARKLFLRKHVVPVCMTKHLSHSPTDKAHAKLFKGMRPRLHYADHSLEAILRNSCKGCFFHVQEYRTPIACTFAKRRFFQLQAPRPARKPSTQSQLAQKRCDSSCSIIPTSGPIGSCIWRHLLSNDMNIEPAF
jgi:hypothetical protein